MGKLINKLCIGLAGFIGIVLIALSVANIAWDTNSKRVSKQHVSISQQRQTFSYKGEAGKDAFQLLKIKTPVEQAPSGLVISINGRKADNEKREFWAFYVNEEMAQVGPGEYQTKSTDHIIWKIEYY